MWSSFSAAILVIFVSVLVNVGGADDPYDELQTEAQTIVHLFEWKWTWIAQECEDYLQYNGFGAVQVSPPMDHITGDPWWTRYQPVSYELCSRSGNRDEFIDMVQRCNAVGVRIIVDAVNNHVASISNCGTKGYCGSSFDGCTEEFYDIPFGHPDTNDNYCDRDISQADYTCCADNVRRCRLSSLIDLNHDTDYVRTEISNYWNDVISIGVGGLRLDAAKHMYPGNIQAMLDMTTNLKSDVFGNGKRIFSVGEVIDYGGEAVSGDEYVGTGRITNFKYGKDLSNGIWRNKNMKYFWNFGPAWNYWDSHDVIAFVDDHDTERDEPPDVLTYKDGALYQLAVGYMLSWNYGIPRVLSSYYFTTHDQGPPSTAPKFNSDQTCDYNSGWVCQHRWPATRRMGSFRKKCQGTPVANIYNNTDNCLAFSRQGCGFFALNNGFNTWTFSASTSLPAGTYCDIYSGEHQSASENGCSGITVNVDGNGYAQLSVPTGDFIAIYI